MNSIYENIQILCKEHNLSIADLERELNYSRNTLFQLKSRNLTNTKRIIEIADYFNVSTDFLLGRTREKNINTSNSHNNISNSSGNISITNNSHSNNSFSEEKYNIILAELLKINHKLDNLKSN